MARPPTKTEQLGRWVRKNRATAIGTGLVAATLIVATLVSISFAVDAGRQRDVAAGQRDLAADQRDAAQLAKEEADRQREIAERRVRQAAISSGVIGEVEKRLHKIFPRKSSVRYGARLIDAFDRFIEEWEGKEKIFLVQADQLSGIICAGHGRVAQGKDDRAAATRTVSGPGRVAADNGQCFAAAGTR